VSQSSGSSRADFVAAWAIGIGVGLIILQLTWLIANRIAGIFWAPPAGPTIAFATAVAAGLITAIIAGRRLAHKAANPETTRP
jgi:hypothetical protein